MLSPMTGLRAGPAPLTLEALGRWASIAAAAGDSSRGFRFVESSPLSGGKAPYHLSADALLTR